MLTKALFSRALLKTLRNSPEHVKEIKRSSSHGVWCYRVPPPNPPKRSILIAEGLGGIAWWWVLYHIWTEPGHIIGEWTYIEPSTWSDEELGIPPDSAGPLRK